MADAKETCRAIIAAALNEFIKEKDPQAEAVAAENIVIQNAPNPEMGDLGSPMFAFAKALRMAPPQIAAGVVAKITDKSFGEFIAVGPYVNVSRGIAVKIQSTVQAFVGNFLTALNPQIPEVPMVEQYLMLPILK